MQLSIILPCYNVAPYIGRCLDSLLAQDITPEEYEIICVDDCSSDNTVNIIQDYQSKFSNITLFKHNTNKTAGGARNTGLTIAKGDYIWFVDPDDCVEPNVIGGIFKKAIAIDADLLFFNMNHIDEDNKIHHILQFSDIDEILPGQEFVLKYCPQKRLAEITSIYRCFYKRSFCIENGISYPEIKSSQDVIFIWRCLLLSCRVSSISTICYNYIRRLNSTTGNKGKYNANAIVSSSLLFPNEVLNLSNEFSFCQQCFKDDLKFVIRNAINDNARKLLSATTKERIRFRKEILNYSQIIETLSPFMNRKTRRLFNYKLPSATWLCMVCAYSAFRK